MPSIPLSPASMFRRATIALLAFLVVAAPSTALASSDAPRVSEPAVASKDCTSGTPTTATTDGVNFTFGSDVASSVQTAVKDDITYARDYGKRTLGVRVDALDICAYGSTSGLAEAESQWMEQPGAYDGLVNFWQTSGAIGVASGLTSTADGSSILGFFALTSNRGWEFASVSQEVVAHEYFHLVQHQLSSFKTDMGPTWLTEGSAEFYAQLVLSDKTGVDFAKVRDSLRLSVASYKGSLKDLEDQTVFGSASNVGYSYNLATLAVDALSPKGDMTSVAAYYKDIGKGTAWRDAFIHAFGTSVDAFYGSFSVSGQ